jgi:hypothetical protein
MTPTSNSILDIETAPLEALGRLGAIATRDNRQSGLIWANFLRAWHNAENGGSDPTDLWNVDAGVADDLGFEPEINAICQLWRGAKP